MKESTTMNVNDYPLGIRILFPRPCSSEDDDSALSSAAVSRQVEPTSISHSTTTEATTTTTCDSFCWDDITLDDSESQCSFASESVGVAPHIRAMSLQRRAKRIALEDLLDDDDDSSCHFSTAAPAVDGDEEIYFTEGILDYDPKSKKYLVSWQGYEETTWEPWENIFDMGYETPLTVEADAVRLRVLRARGLPDSDPRGKKRVATKAVRRSASKEKSPGVRKESSASRSRKRVQDRSVPVRSRRTTTRTTIKDTCDGSTHSLRTNAVHRVAQEEMDLVRPVDSACKVVSVFGGKAIKVRVGAKLIQTFLGHWISERVIPFDIQLSGKEKSHPQKISFSGHDCELLCVRIDDDKEAGSMFVGSRPKKATAVYVSLSPCQDGSQFNLKDFILGFGDFSVLDPRKIASRLELFQSPAKFIEPLPLDVFGEIEEQGNVGCGFIASDFLEQLCKRGGVKHAEMVSAIQVRLFIPSMGIFKGMLQKKLIVSGPMIQLPPSMKKVPASTRAEHSELGYIVVCQAGVHTAHEGINDYIGRKFNGTLQAHKTFEKLIKNKELKEMVCDLWSSLGVSEEVEEVLKRYKLQSCTARGHNHAWVVGTADPTGRLPPDYVFIPGMGKTPPEEVFVTRAPCLRHDDGRLLLTVTSQPRGMSHVEWAFLNSLPFGSIIFSRPRAGKMSMPERIARGDLDGDLYMICWDDEVLAKMVDVDEMPDLDMEDDGTLKTLPLSNPHWLEDAQKLMSDAEAVNEIGRLRGKLYKMSMEIGKESTKKKRDPDAMALADAFNQALEFTKHGRPIRLPAKLIADDHLKQFKNRLTPL